MQVFTVCFTDLENLAFWKCPEMYFSLDEFHFTMIIVAFVFDWSLNMSGEWFFKYFFALSIGTPVRTRTDKALSFRFMMGVASPASLADIAVCSVKPARPLVFLLYHLLLLVFCFVSFAFFNAGWMFLNTGKWQQCIVAKIRAVRQSNFDNDQAHWSLWHGNTGA